MTLKPEIVNAKIVKTMLGIEDLGVMTFFLFCEWPGAGCGLGGYGIDSHKPPNQRIGHGHSYQAIRIILETVGVTSWEKLPGTLVRIEDTGGRLTKIGHIMEDRWFDIEEYMKRDDS